MQIPKNVIQTGEPDPCHKIYVEDYVHTLLTQYRENEADFCLYGKLEQEGEITYYFIYGAAKEEPGWELMESRYFALQRRIGEVTFDEKDAWAFFEDGYSAPLSGCFIFYEQNEDMQSYLIAMHQNRPGESPVPFRHRAAGQAGPAGGPVKENAGSGITEYDVAMKLIEVRSECPDYMGESFPAIVGFGANAALPHYAPTEEDSSVIRPEGFLLIDTGAQYTYGTTDTTRTIPLGPLTQTQKNDYTVALKGMIDLSMAVFYKGMRGCLLDILARGPIMKAGRMYWHGTCHGIGHNLCVHEGPQSVRMEENPVALAEGMVMSNEPALYVEGEYGIRHENAVLVVPHEKNSYGEFLAFETLTVTPVDMSPVNYDLLDNEERAWIEAYNKRAETML